MEVSKSNLYEKRKESEAPPVPPVESAENLEILEQIRRDYPETCEALKMSHDALV